MRWRLEVMRTEQPQHALVGELLKLPVYTGRRDSVEELQALHRQARELASILERWNQGGKLGELFVANSAATGS